MQTSETHELLTRVDKAVIVETVPGWTDDLTNIRQAELTRALQELGWQAQRGLTEMMADAWRWQAGNPRGYGGDEVRRAIEALRSSVVRARRCPGFATY